jgi:hypothetical protein
VIKQVFFAQIAAQNCEKMQFAAAKSRELGGNKGKTENF